MSSKKILIVDDEKDIVETLKFMLEVENFDCITAYDGDEALNKTKTEKMRNLPVFKNGLILSFWSGTQPLGI